MEVTILHKKSKAMKVFDKEEWKLYDQKHFGREVEWKTHIYFLKAYEGKEIIGTMELKIEAGTGSIKTLLVEHTKQRSGVGKFLIQKAEELTREHNGHKLFLSTGINWDAMKFYKAMGFIEEGVLKNHYFNIDFIQFAKFLK